MCPHRLSGAMLPTSGYLLTGFVLWLMCALLPSSVRATTIVDSLGAATPTTQFDLNLTSGISISPDQFVGPRFTVDDGTVLTSIGGFIGCGVALPGPCPAFESLTVQIRASVSGVPDPSTTLAEFPLSGDDIPLKVLFHSAAMNLPLSSGTYFALFADASPIQAFLLSSSIPANYVADPIPLGVVRPAVGTSHVISALPAAVQITVVPEPTTLLIWGGTMAGLGLASRRGRRSRS